MTTVHHTPHAYHADLTSVEINRPLSELDAAIETVITTGSGTSTTLTAQALAGQASLTVASSAGFAVGDPIYLGTGALFESRIIATVPDGVTITVTVNLSNTYAIGKPVSKSPVEIVDARGGFTTLGGRIGLIEGQVFNVRKYGATGDGTTDDLAAFQAAVTALNAAGGGIIYVPNGNYDVGLGWTIDADLIHVELAPGATIFTDGATTDGHTIGFIGGGAVLGAATTPQKTWASIRGGRVHNLNNGTADNAIGFVRYANARCEGVRITAAGRKAITAQYGVSNAYFVNNTISTTGFDAITAESTCNNVHIEGNSVALAGGKGINVTTAITDLRIVGNTIYDSVGDGIALSGVTRGWVSGNTLASAGGSGINGTTCADLGVVDNIIVLPQQHGVSLASGTGRIEVARNFLDRVGQALANTYDAIVFSACTSRPIVSANRVAGTNHRYAQNALDMSGNQAISSGNILLAGGSGVYGGWVPASLNDLVDGIAMVAANAVTTTVTVPVHVVQATAAPTTGTWLRGDICWNSAPSAAGTPGWVCTTAGTPGTWKAMAAVAA